MTLPLGGLNFRTRKSKLVIPFKSHQRNKVPCADRPIKPNQDGVLQSQTTLLDVISSRNPKAARETKHGCGLGYNKCELHSDTTQIDFLRIFRGTD